DPEVIILRVARRDLSKRCAIAKSDFEDTKRLAAKQDIKVKFALLQLDTIAGQQLVQGTLLPFGQPTFTPYKAANPAQ
ncbi:MAG: hypothetical protein R3354_02070, partial [Thiohalomonadales bacterium]|nr:hypothetical protein [Thiohalomonadales bacterium]